MDTELLTTAQAAAHATQARRFFSAGTAAIRPTTIRDWAARGHLERSGLTDRGHPLYDLADVARAELATRARALRLVGIPEPQ
ncbi:MerR family transcriptional regulator [Streptomyces sp. JV180]|uniref:MerR family transcriptional regulator n=1 Tax=Streptomyces sp. JV180 TaxID=858634 RepID=UPI00168A5E51|nr:MerR family transcriptional regulator [Streptomyces sp. JV180]MBD3546823.1 MerR family transcriptional regulator [Streptomyces sp. JV180]